jgi:adenylylsulfate kinase
MELAENIIWHDAAVSKIERRQKNKHHSFVLWFTGLSGSGKSTVANAVATELYKRNTSNYVLDGDNIRHGLNNDLGFSEEDRKENIRRIGEVAKLFVDSGAIVLTAFISPFREDRNTVRHLLEKEEFVEVYVDCSLKECENRDPKGLYKKARSGEIKEFTGIDSPYEQPVNPEITINTETSNLQECVTSILKHLEKKNWI